jgi:hypothetical protein
MVKNDLGETFRMQKLIIGAVIFVMTAVGMRAFGVGIGDIFKAVQADATNAAADIKALFRGDFKKVRLSELPQPKVGANEGDYDEDMKKDLAEERQKYLEERRRAVDKIMSSAPDKADTDALRKQIEQNVKDAAGKN